MCKAAVFIMVIACLAGGAAHAAMSPEMRAQAEAMVRDEGETERFGAWEFRVTTDVLTDQVSYTLNLDGARVGGHAALITAAFVLTGGEAALQRMAQACHWKLD